MSNSGQNGTTWGQAAIDTQLRLDRANRAAIEAAGGVLPMHRATMIIPQNQK